ncbi:restriction endonuclease subunit S [Brevibacillus fluminis]|uniref:restriction endonuclease subunit S n=1 Tax=Brevibacillus fluminis TaxID=511487 RepID=UPI003F8CAF10
MGLSRLGELIEQVNRKNSALQYGIDDVRGVMNTKGMMQTRANVTDRSFDKFYIIEPGEFVFNRRTTRNGERLGLAFNDTNRAYIFTEDYVAFTIKDKEKLLPEYLYIFFQRDEFDRLVRYSSWGSATEFFNWEDMCDIVIDLPPLSIQQKYVDIYNALLQNQKAYESGLEDLKLACDAYIDELRRTLPHKAIGEYIELSEAKNENLQYGIDALRGVSINKVFIETKADMTGVSLKPYLLVEPDAFAYVPITSRNGEKISLAHNSSDETYIVSSSYIVFRVNQKDKLIPSYLNIFFGRSEFDRYARFNSWGSAREAFAWEDMCEVKIPIPDIKVQRSIVNIYNAYITRRDINEKLKAQIKDICPILIKGSLDEAKNTGSSRLAVIT